jgi:beta-lactam-binding protein with PASTA domain
VSTEPEPTERARAGAAAEVTERAARERRRRSSVRVPDVVGLAWDGARNVLLEHGLLAMGPDPDGPPPSAAGWPDGVVTDQSPESGAKVPSGSTVRLWVERGGGPGVREPRRPRPSAGTGREMRPEPSDEPIG